MSANPPADLGDRSADVVVPVWDIDASAHLAADQRLKVARGDLLTQETEPQPTWNIDIASVAPTQGKIALVVSYGVPGTDISELSALFHALDAGDRALGGQGLSLEPGLSRLEKASSVLVLRPHEPKGANARLQSLVEPLGGAGTIADWKAANSGPASAADDLATELAKPSSAEPRSVASFRNKLSACVVVL